MIYNRQGQNQMLKVGERIDLPGDWYLIKCEDADSPHYLEWFLSTPDKFDNGVNMGGIWVAKFWDGPQAGESDCRSFAASVNDAFDEIKSESESAQWAANCARMQG